MNEPVSDDEMLRELEHWGNREVTPSRYSVQDLHQYAREERRRATGLVVLACVVMGMAFLSLSWLTDLQPQKTAQQEAESQTKQSIADPKLLLQSIAERSKRIEARVENIKSRYELQKQSESDIAELNARILHFKRTAAINKIALTQSP
jgi:small-conductance mechanosensitive channel